MDNASKIEIGKIISKLDTFPKDVLIEICLSVSKLVLPYWENYFDNQEEGLDIFRKISVRQAIEISAKWLHSKNDSYLIEAETISDQIWSDMEKVAFFCEESSGDTETVKNRNKAFSAIECVYQTIQCVLWTESKVEEEFSRKEFTNELNQLVFDVIEKQARKNNGAVFETSQAIFSARLVIENDEIILREIEKIIND